MRKEIIILTTLLMAFVLLAGFSCQNKQTAPVGQPTPAIESPKTTENTKNIAIKNFAFSPAELTIKAGDTVIWTNDDSAPHTIKSENFNSQTLSTGDIFSFKFARLGTYDYICGIHPSMKGKIIVE
jgi:plastocyanin